MREKQPELFQDLPKDRQSFWNAYKNTLFNKTSSPLYVTFEQTVFFLCGIILLTLFSYSLGVHQGKKRAVNIADVERADITQPVVVPIQKEQKITPLLQESSEVTQKKEMLEQELFYTVQVATYTKETHAVQEITFLKKGGFEAFSRKSGGYYQVFVGVYPSSSNATKDLAKLKKRYGDAFIKKMKNSN
ncbi:MAG: SPOR domain-containing protein [Candidatus Omnitrophica bacterium]|nr:SPOR domain-containing protein [Candidatus Omnitrophota bacterium]